ncbi:MAG: hypothetical protein EP320_00680 [Rhodobacteraceae bacterium]|nr:hypothetical protein [Stutzerimonas balearica]TNF16809.1 MAG: hypothetical protein EP320_00680 [Paracoccaceae bacterium]
MTKNKLGDLDDHLFAQLERLADESMTAEQIEQEVKRSEAIVALADKVTENSKVKLTAAKLYAEHREAVMPYLPQIGKAPE